MNKILILYASSTGNTEEIAFLLEQQLDSEDYEISMKNLELEAIDTLDVADYDGILFGTYTYDDGDLPFETEVFCDNFQSIDLSGKVIGVFGSGDTAYDQFCEAVDTMKKVFRHRNALVLEHAVKVDLFPDNKEELESIKEMSILFKKALAEQVMK